VIVFDGVCRPVEQAPQPWREHCAFCAYTASGMTAATVNRSIDWHWLHAHRDVLKREGTTLTVIARVVHEGAAC
jgi:hypothetical protein